MFSGMKASVEAFVLTHGSQLLASPLLPSGLIKHVVVLVERHNRPFVASIYAAVSIRADGKPLERCIFGPEGDCTRCGCNISTSFVALREGNKETARMVLLPARRAGIA